MFSYTPLRIVNLVYNKTDIPLQRSASCHISLHILLAVMEYLLKSDKIISGHENDFVLPTIHTEAKKRFISFNGVKVWKRIPEHLKTTNRFHQFKKDLSKYLLKST